VVGTGAAPREPAGDFRSAIEVIDGGALQRHGITGIGIAAYPDGHPRISQQDLDRSLADKIQSAETTGMAVHIVTQFGFDAQAILQWIARLREFGVEHPVRIGLAGPTNLATLLRYPNRCGVRLRPGARPPGRPAAAVVRHVRARWLSARAGAGARRQAPRRDRAAFLFLRRLAAHGALGRGGGAAPDRACGRRGGPSRAAGRRGLTRQPLSERRAQEYLPARSALVRAARQTRRRRDQGSPPRQAPQSARPPLATH